MDVASFKIDHDRMERGVYVSRRDRLGDSIITTFDLRMVKPNTAPYISPKAIHTLEHLLAIYLRTYSGEWMARTIYVGPMGCRTGMYLILAGELSPQDILTLLRDAYQYAAGFEGEVPASTSKECGNYLEHDLPDAKRWAEEYLELLNNIKPQNMAYPE